MRLDTALVKVVGDKTAAKLDSELGLHTLGDLLHHYPRRYFPRGQLTPLRDLVVGEHVTVLARVQSVEVRPTRNGKVLGKVVVSDGTGSLDLTFFGRIAHYYSGKLKPGATHLVAGTVSTFNGRQQLTHPEVFVEPADEKTLEKAGALVPVYAATKGISTLQISRCVDLALSFADLDDDPLPVELRAVHGLVGLRTAMEDVHHPGSPADVERAATRLRWDEAAVLQVLLAQRRAEHEAEAGVPRSGRSDGLLEAFERSLPFTLTAGQREVGDLLEAELAASTPMHRLLQGEVGSGKTLVALRAMLRVVDSGGQAALLAPTEVLAQQHATSLRELLGPLGRSGQLDGAVDATGVALLTGSLGTAARREALSAAASGAAGIVVGTHALLSEGVAFADLGLVVVDEQHRFGVEQRDALRAKGTAPHVLVMTATPIPRTVAMTTYGDLEVSTLRELPAGRSPITTSVQSYQRLGWVLDLVRAAAREGHQTFVVCPRIGDEDDPGAPPEGDRRPPMAVVEVAQRLDVELAGLRVGVLHGRLLPGEKEHVMASFAGGEVEVLVATTVIEVGVDVPNATLMVVMDAERFGLSQLHQLRGRIGRGSAPGRCVLLTELPRDAPSTERLFRVAETTDGFALSEADLELRREGDVLGAAQSGGRRGLHFLTLQDTEVIEQTRAWARDVVARDPGLAQHPALAEAVRSSLGDEQAAFFEKA